MIKFTFNNHYWKNYVAVPRCCVCGRYSLEDSISTKWLLLASGSTLCTLSSIPAFIFCNTACWMSLSNRHVWSYVLGSFMSILYYPARCHTCRLLGISNKYIAASAQTGQCWFARFANYNFVGKTVWEFHCLVLWPIGIIDCNLWVVMVTRTEDGKVWQHTCTKYKKDIFNC